MEEIIEETKVWSWGIKFTDVLEMYNGPTLLNLKNDLLEQVNFGKRLVTRLDLSHMDTIVLLFRDKEHAELYEMGFRQGYEIAMDPEAYLQSIKSLWKDMHKEKGGEE